MVESGGSDDGENERENDGEGETGDDDDDDDDDDVDDDGTEDTPSEGTDDDDSDVGGATRRDEADGEPWARTRQSPRLAELEAGSAAGTTTTPRVSNTTTHRLGDE